MTRIGLGPSRATAAAVFFGLGLAACGDRFSADGDPPTAGGGGEAPPPPPPELPAVPAQFSLLSAFGAPGEVRARFTRPADEAGLELALFLGPDPDGLLAGAPAALVPPGVESVSLPSTDGELVSVLLAARVSAAEPWVQSGPVLRARAGAPIYVDPAADPLVADGLTPATAHTGLLIALLEAAGAGGANVWVAGGQLGAPGFPVLPGVHVTGGFASGFDPDERDPEANPSTIVADGPGTLLRATEGALPVVLDGLVLDGMGLASAGLDVDAVPVELRGLRVTRCAGPGVRAGAPEDGPPRALVVAGCLFDQNGAEGLSAAGGFAIDIEASRFEANVQEGLDIDDLVAPPGETARLVVRASRFAANGTDGLDCDLSAPLAGGFVGGDFVVRLIGCTFDLNGAEGLLVDVDFELFPAWTADVLVQGCVARANAREGIHLDLDLDIPALVHRCVATANGLDGVLLSSDAIAGVVVISATVCAGNLGAGVRAAEGAVAPLLSHCVLTGNANGGLRSPVAPASAASTVAWVQDASFGPALKAGALAVADPANPPFLRAPHAFATVLDLASGAVQLGAPLDVLPGEVAEVDDDGVERVPTALAPDSLALDPAPAVAPRVLALFAADLGVDEDWRLAPDSPAAGVGMADPAGEPVDAGPWGAPAPGPPGSADALPVEPFRLARAEPVPGEALGALDEVLLRFAGGAPDPATLLPGVVRVVDADGAELAAGVLVDGDTVRLSPPAGGWPADFRVEVHGGLAATSGAPLATPVALPY